MSPGEFCMWIPWGYAEQVNIFSSGLGWPPDFKVKLGVMTNNSHIND